MLEKLTRDRLVNHLKENYLLRDTQHSFRNKRSCLTNPQDFLNIVNEYDKSKILDIVYLDFQQVFDKVCQKHLIATVKTHGIQGDIVTWIEN